MRNFCSRLRRNSAAWADSAGVSSLPISSIITKLSSITFAVDAVASLDGPELGIIIAVGRKKKYLLFNTNAVTSNGINY